MSKSLLTFTIIFFLNFIAFSQINGITETGDEVILFKNGTWQYVNDSINVSNINKNDKPFFKSKTSTFLVKSNKTNIGVWINPKKWSFSKADSNSPAEFKFDIKSKDIHGMLIAEKIKLPLENLIEIAFDNAKEAAPDIRVVKKEYRTVNGLELIMMQLAGTIQGIEFIYFGYYYSSSTGSFQLLTYTSQDLFDESKKDMEELINGIIERE